MTAQAQLVERLRGLLADEPTVREVSMLGGRSFMVNEKMIVSALKDGSLLVRVAAEQHDALLDRPGARRAEMGDGRDMGPGWIDVAASAITNDEKLAPWIDTAMAHNTTVMESAGEQGSRTPA